MSTVYAKAAIACILMLAAFLIAENANRRHPQGVLPFGQTIMLAIAVRVALFVFVYAILKMPLGSDVPAYYYPQSHAALAGELWNRDYQSSYSPLFPYLGAVLLKIADTPLVFCVFALGLDVVALYFWHRVLKKSGGEEAATAVSLAYALSGPVILNALVGQQQIWIGAGLAVSAWLLLNERPLASALMQGVVLCVTKILALLFWPVLWAAGKRKIVWAFAAGVLPVVVLAIFVFAGADVLRGLRAEQMDFTSGNLVYYASFLLGVSPAANASSDAVTVLCLGIAALAILWRFMRAGSGGGERLVGATAFIFIVLMLASKKSYANYLSFAYYPLLFVLYRHLRGRAFWAASLVFAAVSSMQASLWFARGGNGLSLNEWVAQSGWSAALPTIGVEAILIAIYIAILIWSGRDLFRVKSKPI